MDALIRRLIQSPPAGSSPGEFAQSTLGQLIQTLENIALEHRNPFRVIYGWNRRHFPDMPLLPANRHLPQAYYHALDRKLTDKSHSLIYLYDDGADCFSLAGTLADRPGISVFEQRLPVDAVWSFDRRVHAQLCKEVARLTKTKLPPLQERQQPVNLSGRFHGRLIKHLEESLLETRQTLNLITGILRVQKTISSELDFERLLELIGDTLISTFRFDMGELDLYSSEERRLYHQVTWNASGQERSISQNLQILLDLEQERELFVNGSPVVLDKLQSHSIILNHKLVEILGLRFSIFLPLISGDEKVGLLKMYYGQSEIISPARLTWLEELSRLLANAILNAREHTRVFELATKDGLTNLHNRRYFEEQFYLELARTERTGQPLCMLMLDVDNFKVYNDRNGHLAGDDVLVRVARLVKGCIRSVDFIARYGGEEFIILLTGADLEVGLRVGEKIRKRIEVAEFPNEEVQPSGCLTVSIGVTQLQPDVRNMEQMIQMADRALYSAKEQGRNRVEQDTEGQSFDNGD